MINLFGRLKKRNKRLILEQIEKSHRFFRYMLLIIGLVISAIAYNLFFAQNNIVAGGVTGIAIITQDYIKPSIMILILNVIALIFSMIFLGKKTTIDSLLGSLLFPVFIALTSNIGNYIKIDNSDMLLIVIIGAVVSGFASGILFKSGFNSGGTDIFKQIIAKYGNMSVGKSMLIVDGIIVLMGGFSFGWTRVLYALIVIYIVNIVVDKVMLGISENKAVYITTDKDDEICDYLLNELGLGITLYETRGGYTNKKDQVIMCVASTSDYFKVKDGIEIIDPNAVMLVTDAYQASGIYNKKANKKK